ncbi:MAG: SUMF1/EgtB/PvdO family nonheme iron enzyme [Chloroflexi bacterium]|nr:SUMF1/EgtB/PvdO family nonheme iron enzyme [Chloroflexota bacterium]
MSPSNIKRLMKMIPMLGLALWLNLLMGCAPATPPSPTATPSPMPSPTSSFTATPAPLGFTPVTTNSDWTPVKQEFDGVTMLLVPAGCFLLGSTGINSNEMPEHRQCFTEPFWIDQTEVTNQQFARFNGQAEKSSYWDGELYPRDRITGLEAVAYCQLRGARLPTEREWEYAASGPDNLLYPWGSDWDETRALWKENSNGRPKSVGSYPTGVSWVGVLDMSGSVWEWTSSIYRPYAYDPGDGRESPLNIRDFRVLRGGSWANEPAQLITSMRLRYAPNLAAMEIGLRCARTYAE